MDKNHVFELKCNQVLAMVNMGISNKEIMASAGHVARGADQ